MVATITPNPPRAEAPTILDNTPPTILRGIPSFTKARLDGGNDSGYSSQTQSPDGKALEEGTISYRGPPIPFSLNFIKKKTSLFNIDIDERTRSRFKAIQPNLENLLLSHVRASLGPGTDYRPISMRLVMMGTSKDDAQPCIVVFCRTTLKKLIKGFMKGKIISDICCPEETGIPHFQISVVGNAPRLRRARVEVVADELVVDIFGTLCGIPIQFHLPDGRAINATLGGLIKIVTASGDISLVGLTAGHALWDEEMEIPEDIPQASYQLNLLPSDQHDNELGNMCHQEPRTPGDLLQNVPPSNSSEKIDMKPLESSVINHSARISEGLDRSAFPDQDDEDSDSEIDWAVDSVIPITGDSNRWSFDTSKVVGHYTESQDHWRAQRNQCYDWALVETSIFELNSIAYNRKAQLTVSYRQPGTTGPKPVILCGGSKDVRHGELLPGSGRLLLGNGIDFVNAHMVTVGDGEPGICDGDSGLWVVDSRTFEVYGQLVASDILGGGYVIPLSDIFEDIRICLGVQAVELPSVIDILHARIHQQEKAILRKNQPNEFDDEDNDRMFSVTPAQSPPSFDSGYVSCNITPTVDPWDPVGMAVPPAPDSGYSSHSNTPQKRWIPPTTLKRIQHDFGSETDNRTSKKQRQDD